MRQLLFLIGFFFLQFSGYSQDTVLMFFDNNFQVVDKNQATIVRMAINKNDHYYITDQFLEGKMINYGQYSSIAPEWIEDGLSISYNKDGSLYSQGYYKQGRLVARWVYFSVVKNDTVNYTTAHNYYSFKNDSCTLKNAINKEGDTTLVRIKDELNEFISARLKLPAKNRTIPSNYVVNVDLIVDVDGTIKCPKILDNNIDLIYETLRVLFLYKSRYDIKEPKRVVFPIRFNETQAYNDNNPPTEILDKSDKNDEGVWFVENSASFQGGDINTFNIWLKDHVQYPIEAVKAKAQGKVIAQFSINKTGEICDIKIIKSVHPALDKEVIRLLISSPKWTPATIDGKPVKQNFVIPVAFTLN